MFIIAAQYLHQTIRPPHSSIDTLGSLPKPTSTRHQHMSGSHASQRYHPHLTHIPIPPTKPPSSGWRKADSHLDLLFNHAPLLLLCPRAFLLHPHELGIPLTVELVLALLPLSGELVLILGQLRLVPGILLRCFAGLFSKDPLALLKTKGKRQC